MALQWRFYGRRTELEQLQAILQRKRWFFLQISGRRRIGKTTLIQQALAGAGVHKTLYIQIPDSDPAGVVAACNGYLEKPQARPCLGQCTGCLGAPTGAIAAGLNHQPAFTLRTFFGAILFPCPLP